MDSTDLPTSIVSARLLNTNLNPFLLWNRACKNVGVTISAVEKQIVLLGKNPIISTQFSRNNIWGEPNEFCAKSDDLKDVGVSGRGSQPGKNEPDFCMSFAETALRMTGTIARKKVRKLVRIIFDPIFDAGKLRRYLKIVEDC